MPYAPAYVCAFLGATAIGYILHARFTFAGASLQAASPGRYLLVSATMLGITSLQFLLLVDIFHVWYIAASVSLAALNIPVNFLVHRRVSYGLRYSAADPPPA